MDHFSLKLVVLLDFYSSRKTQILLQTHCTIHYGSFIQTRLRLRTLSCLCWLNIYVYSVSSLKIPNEALTELTKLLCNISSIQWIAQKGEFYYSKRVTSTTGDFDQKDFAVSTETFIEFPIRFLQHPRVLDNHGSISMSDEEIGPLSLPLALFVG